MAGVHENNVLLSICLIVRGAGLGAATVSVMAAAFEQQIITYGASAANTTAPFGVTFRCRSVSPRSRCFPSCCSSAPRAGTR